MYRKKPHNIFKCKLLSYDYLMYLLIKLSNFKNLKQFKKFIHLKLLNNSTKIRIFEQKCPFSDHKKALKCL